MLVARGAQTALSGVRGGCQPSPAMPIAGMVAFIDAANISRRPAQCGVCMQRSPHDSWGIATVKRARLATVAATSTPMKFRRPTRSFFERVGMVGGSLLRFILRSFRGPRPLAHRPRGLVAHSSAARGFFAPLGPILGFDSSPANARGSWQRGTWALTALVDTARPGFKSPEPIAH